MMRYRGGMWAPQGLYLELGTWEAKALPRGGKMLEGTEKSVYIRLPIPPVLMPFLGALVGGLYIIFLPFVAVAYLLWLLAAKAWKGLLAVTDWLVEGRRRA